MIRFMPSLLLPVAAYIKACFLALGLMMAAHVGAQVNDVDQIAKAQEAIENRNWAAAEAILKPLVQSQPKNPFVFYDMAQVYENTNRVDSAKQIYQSLTNTLSADPNQYTVVVRAPYANRLVSLMSLAQAKLSAINAKQAAAVRVVATIPPPPTVTATTMPRQANNPPASKESHAAVTAAMKSWAAAWVNKDMANYYGSYREGFHGEFPSRAAWEKQRSTNMGRAKNIEINFSNVEMTALSTNRVQVQFIQRYTSSDYSDTSHKTMVFAQNNDRWLIERESTK